MNVLVDTDVWVDIALRRKEHFSDSAAAVNLLGRPGNTPYASAHSVTTVYFLVSRERDRTAGLQAVEALLQHASVAPVDGSVIHDATESSFDDFEDAVIESAARRAGLDAIITRNVSDFDGSRLPVYTPTEFISASTV